jgi:hypothetical protein
MTDHANRRRSRQRQEASRLLAQVAREIEGGWSRPLNFVCRDCRAVESARAAAAELARTGLAYLIPGPSGPERYGICAFCGLGHRLARLDSGAEVVCSHPYKVKQDREPHPTLRHLVDECPGSRLPADADETARVVLEIARVHREAAERRAAREQEERDS